MSTNKDYIEKDEDSIIIYDETDDQILDEIETDSEYHLKTNEEIFTDKYMNDFAEKMDNKIAKEKRTDIIVSFCVIVGIIGIIFIIALLSAYCYLL